MAAATEPLTSGLFTEISFRRLLNSCNDIISGDTKGRADLTQWQTSPVFHHYVETLQEQLGDLSASRKLDDHILNDYTRQVNAIADSLKPVVIPAFAIPQQTTRQPTAAKTPNNNNQNQANKPSTSALPPAKVPTVRATDAVAAQAAALKPIAISDQAKARLEGQGRTQENLTEELADMAASLKANTVSISDKLKERGELLDVAEDALDKSAQGTKAASASATVLRKRNRWNFCLTCMVLFSLGLGLAGMYVFIRFTRLAGYSAAKANKAASLSKTTPTAAAAGTSNNNNNNVIKAGGKLPSPPPLPRPKAPPPPPPVPVGAAKAQQRRGKAPMVRPLQPRPKPPPPPPPKKKQHDEL